MSKAQELEELLTPYITEAGYEAVDVTFEKSGQDWILTAYIDTPGGVTLEDCEKVSQILSPVLDEEDPIEQSYLLEVSSPGLDRPLKKLKDYQRKIGEEIEINLYAKKDGQKVFTGILKEAGDNSIILTTENGDLEFTYKEISKAVPIVTI